MIKLHLTGNWVYYLKFPIQEGQIVEAFCLKCRRLSYVLAQVSWAKRKQTVFMCLQCKEYLGTLETEREL